jgi:hypothetical protein
MSIASLSIAQLQEAIVIKKQIVSLHEQLAKLVWDKHESITAPKVPAKKARKGISAAGKARIVAAQKARWAKVKGAAPAAPAPSTPVKKTRQGMSAAGKAKIAAAQKTRWAKVKGTAPVSTSVAAKAAPAAKPAKKAKRKLSPEGRAKIVAALKKRWAAKKK